MDNSTTPQDSAAMSPASTGSVDEPVASDGPCYPDDLGIFRNARGLSERCKELADRLVRQGIRARVTAAESEALWRVSNRLIDFNMDDDAATLRALLERLK